MYRLNYRQLGAVIQKTSISKHAFSSSCRVHNEERSSTSGSVNNLKVSETPEDTPVNGEHKVWQEALKKFSSSTKDKESSYDDMLSKVAGYERSVNNAETTTAETDGSDIFLESLISGNPIVGGKEHSEQLGASTSASEPLSSKFTSNVSRNKVGKPQIEIFDINLSSYLEKENSNETVGNRFEKVKSSDISTSSFLNHPEGDHHKEVDADVKKYKDFVLRKKHKEEELEKKLQPILNNIDKQIKCDNDLLTVISKYIVLLRSYLSEMSKRKDTKVNDKLKNKLANTLLIKDPLDKDLIIPGPIQETIPFIIKFLLTSEKYDFVGQDGKYIVLSWVHNVCKNYHKDINLYLSVFTIELYNYLLELTWAQYKDISSVFAIVSEMRSNGVKGDIDTIKILERLDFEIEKNQVLIKSLDRHNGNSNLKNNKEFQGIHGVRLIRSHGQLQQRSKLQHHLNMLKTTII